VIYECPGCGTPYPRVVLLWSGVRWICQVQDYDGRWLTHCPACGYWVTATVGESIPDSR
jgi:hypothetical protein